AGLTESQVTELKTELDTDSLTAHYDVEFKCGGFEYEYKINAKSGKVISFEKERD
ncbi:MAG: PepSY domain-containing protein, partial [Clostridiales bacterium]